jgi:hypothetical protein
MLFSSALAWGDRAPRIDQGARSVQRLALLLRTVKVHELVLMNHTFEPVLMNQCAFKHSGNERDHANSGHGTIYSPPLRARRSDG